MMAIRPGRAGDTQCPRRIKKKPDKIMIGAASKIIGGKTRRRTSALPSSALLIARSPSIHANKVSTHSTSKNSKTGNAKIIVR